MAFTSTTTNIAVNRKKNIIQQYIYIYIYIYTSFLFRSKIYVNKRLLVQISTEINVNLMQNFVHLYFASTSQNLFKDIEV